MILRVQEVILDIDYMKMAKTAIMKVKRLKSKPKIEYYRNEFKGL